jgi:hypothetical protein
VTLLPVGSITTGINARALTISTVFDCVFLPGMGTKKVGLLWNLDPEVETWLN